MKQPITPKAHGVIDYTTSSAVAMAPHIIDMPKRAAAACYGLAAGYTALSLMTKYPAGAKKVIPYKAHGIADVAIGAAIPFIPRMLGIESKKWSRKRTKKAEHNAQLFFCGLAAMSGIVALMTDWNSPRARGQIGGTMAHENA
jgi:hypothetical protein